MRRILFLVALAGCGDDGTSAPPVSDCDQPAGKQCEVECVGVDDIDPDAVPCTGTDFAGDTVSCDMVAVFDGRHGCCRDAEPNVQRWFECE